VPHLVHPAHAAAAQGPENRVTPYIHHHSLEP
jgi:hypothetical protein